MWGFPVSWVTPSLLLLLIVIISYIWSRRRFAVLASKLPGPRPLPIIGNLHEFQTDNFNLAKTCTRLLKEYGGIVRVWFGNRLVVLISKPEYLQVYHTSTALLDRPFFYRHLAEVFGEHSLMVANGEKWKRLRKIFSTSFHTTPTDIILSNIKAERKTLINYFDAKCDGNSFETWSWVHYSVTRATLKTILGETWTNETIHWFLETGMSASRQVIDRLSYPHLFFNATFKLLPRGRLYYRNLETIHSYARNIIIRKKEELEKMKKNGEPIPKIWIWNILQNHGDESLDTLGKELVTIIFTALDTTSSVICYLFLMMGLYPEIQEKLYQEVEEVKEAMKGKEMKVDDLSAYEYLDRSIREALRIFPVSFLFGRKTSEDTYFGKYLVPKDTSVIFTAMATYWDPDIFPDPLKFDPDRFLPQEVAKRHAYTLSPFSAGPRICPGMRFALISIKILIPGLIHNFKIKSHYKTTQEVMDNIVTEFNVTDKNRFPVRIERRHHST